jgi:hypothetical protein
VHVDASKAFYVSKRNINRVNSCLVPVVFSYEFFKYIFNMILRLFFFSLFVVSIPLSATGNPILKMRVTGRVSETK